MNEFTPTTEQVRDGYAIDPEDEYRDPINAPANRRANERYFDRWLAGVKADAWDEGFKQGGPMHDEHLDDPDAHRRNPYRTGVDA